MKAFLICALLQIVNLSVSILCIFTLHFISEANIVVNTLPHMCDSFSQPDYMLYTLPCPPRTNYIQIHWVFLHLLLFDFVMQIEGLIVYSSSSVIVL